MLKTKQQWIYSCYKGLIAFMDIAFQSHWLPRPSHYHRCNQSIFLPNLLSVQRLDSSQCITFLHCLSFCPQAILPLSFFFAFSYTKYTQKSNYNTAKPILEQQASHSVVEGGWKACSHQTSKLQHVKTGLIACPVQHWDHSSAMRVDQIV